MSSGASLSGAARMRANLARKAQTFPGRVMAGLYQETEVEAKEVKRITPVDKGNLRASIHVVGPFREGRRIWCMVVAGGPAASYALYVHEDLEAFHKVGQAKFIESVIMASRPYMGARVAKRIQLNEAG